MVGCRKIAISTANRSLRLPETFGCQTLRVYLNRLSTFVPSSRFLAPGTDIDHEQDCGAFA